MKSLTVNNLALDIQHYDDTFHILRGVNLTLSRGGSLGIVGESGSGKTLTCLTIMRLLPKGSKIISGQILLGDNDLCQLNENQMQAVRGREICMIFQDARAALNPVLTVGEQIVDIYCNLKGESQQAGIKKAIEALDMMGLPNARSRMKSYPHELSGGMCQRILIAMALVSAPKLLIADEVTTGLDVTIQSQVIDLIKKVTNELNASLIFVSHDIGVIMEACTEIAVMYCGIVLEQGDIDVVLSDALSPYTEALLSCFRISQQKRMNFIPGIAPDLKMQEPGCPFAPRCNHVIDVCHQQIPQLRQLDQNHWVACHVVEKKNSIKSPTS